MVKKKNKAKEKEMFRDVKAENKRLKAENKRQLKKRIRTKAIKTKGGTIYGYKTTSKAEKAREQEYKDVSKRVKSIAKEKDRFSSDKIKSALKERRRNVFKREKKVRGALSMMGVISGSQSYKGAGRPRGTFKHGVPIQVYYRKLRDDKARYQRYQQEQEARLRPRGFTSEQIQQLQQQQTQQLQQQQTYQELEQPSLSRVQQIQQRVSEMRQPIQIVSQGQSQRMRVPTNMHNKLVQPGPSVADEELAFRKWSAETTISANTQRTLDTIRRIQNKGKSDNIEQQRRIRERNMVGRSMNLMKAHENMINTDMDMTGVSEENILMAPNVFREIQGNQILQNNRGAFSLLHTREAGNNLKFF